MLNNTSDIETFTNESNKAELLYATFECIDDAILIVDSSNDNILSINSSFEKSLGYTKFEIIGKQASILFSNNELFQIFKNNVYKQLENSNKAFIENCILLSSDFNEINSLQTVKEIEYENGHSKALVIIIKNSSIQSNTKQLKNDLSFVKTKREEKFKLLIDNINELVCEIDENGVYTYVSKNYKDILGFSSEELLGTNAITMIHPEDLEKSIKKHSQIKEKVSSSVDIWRFKAKSGKYRLIESKGAVYINSKKEKRTVVISRDITDQKQNEEKLIEANAAKDKFFSIIAHDLKNPLSSLVGLSNLLNNNLEKYQLPKKKKIINAIYNNASKTYQLLENLLLWSNAQRDKMEVKLETIVLRDIMVNNVECFKELASAKNIGIYIDCNSNYLTRCDKDMTSTILRNLISNAIKFTPNKGIIELSAEETNNQYQIGIKDNGIGIEKADLEKLFNIAETYTKNGTNGESGSGLGLLLCKEFIEKQNGKIWVESEIGKGTSFYFTLPALIQENIN